MVCGLQSLSAASENCPLRVCFNERNCWGKAIPSKSERVVFRSALNTGFKQYKGVLFMNVRFANTNDIPQMIDLLMQVGQVHHEIRPDLFRAGAQKYDEAALERLLADPSRPILCYEQNGIMVGYCFCILQETKNDPVLCDRKVLYIDDLCVDAGVRGAGIAPALYARAVEYAKEIGCDAVTLNVWCGNDRAMAFYQKSGLTPYKIAMEKLL